MKFNNKDAVIYENKIWEVKRYLNNEICEIYLKEGYSETFMLVDEKLLKQIQKIRIVKFKIGELVLFQNEVCRVTDYQPLSHETYYDITNLRHNHRFVVQEKHIKTMQEGGYIKTMKFDFNHIYNKRFDIELVDKMIDKLKNELIDKEIKKLKDQVEDLHKIVKKMSDNKKYYIHQTINNGYLNFVTLDKIYIIFDSKKADGFQTQFTQQEIDNFPAEIKGAIECGFLRKVEVE
jgi:hypothetical protein